MCLMDLPVRFSVCSRVPPAEATPAPCRCLSLGAGKSRRAGDEIRLIMAALFFGWMCRSRAPVDQETPGQTETHKGSGKGSVRPILCSLPTYTTFCSRGELLPSQPFTRIKAASQQVGTLTFAFCLIQSVFFFSFLILLFSFFLILKPYTPLQSAWGSLISRAFHLATLKSNPDVSRVSQA